VLEAISAIFSFCAATPDRRPKLICANIGGARRRRFLIWGLHEELIADILIFCKKLLSTEIAIDRKCWLSTLESTVH
jgi:hypothetical protein